MVCRECGKTFKAAPRHRLLCGDSREPATMERLFGNSMANLVITSPPYASQRQYDSTSGFRPIPPDEYVTWFQGVAANIAAVLAPNGSYFLNIKEHAEDGERSLYVKDLVLAHKREWGWRFIDELCWRNTRNGVPGGWNNRFKNAWEPIFHFARSASIKFCPDAVSAPSDDAFDYSPTNPKSQSGSGLLGSGKRKNQHAGMARPSNVIEVAAESGQGDHSAPFPRALIEFFIKAFSDAGDAVFDPFAGSGTTIIAAQVLGRNGYGCEISPAYCDLTILRWQRLSGGTARLAGDGRSFDEIAMERRDATV